LKLLKNLVGLLTSEIQPQLARQSTEFFTYDYWAVTSPLPPLEANDKRLEKNAGK